MHNEGSAVADAAPATSVSPVARAVPADPPETAIDVAAAVRDGVADPEQIVAAALERIRRADSKIGAFALVRDERAVAEARAVAEHPELEALPLAGVPIAIKNDIDVAGEPTRGGSPAGGECPAAADHPVVRRLRAAGAVVVGLTELCEFGLFGTTDSPARITRSPWNIRYSAGGSSGGAAAAVAAGLVPVAHGNDGLGSVRVPAAACGVLGVKPGRGVVPAEVGLDSWGGMTENGVFATTVADAALMLSVLADQPALADLEPPAGLRIALAVGSPARLIRVDEQWVRAASDAALSARAAGHTVQEVRLPCAGAALALALRWVGNAAREAAALPHPERLQRRTRIHAAVGRAVLRAGLIRPGQVDRIESRLLDFFDQHDVVITPTLACPPPRAIAWHRRGWLANMLVSVRFSPFAPLWNLVGWPALSIPMGLHPRTGTPVAAQLAGPPGSESTLLRLAAQLEAERPWQRIAPRPHAPGNASHPDREPAEHSATT